MSKKDVRSNITATTVTDKQNTATAALQVGKTTQEGLAAAGSPKKLMKFRGLRG